MKKTLEDIFQPEMPVVPPSWDVLPFEQAADVVSDKGKRVKQGAYLLAGKIPVIDQGQDTIGGYTDDEDMAFDDELPVILFGDHTRSFKYIDRRFAVGAEGVKILRPREGYVPKFLYYLLRSLQIPSRGYSRHFQFLRKFHLPHAPKGQQDRIVAEIEKQFSRLDEAVANLRRVKANLKRYKAAVLKAAVEGKLTEDWRKQHPNVEQASKLLKRILVKRRAKWGGKTKFVEPAVADTTQLPVLPKGWTYTSVDQLGIIGEQAVLTGPFGTNLGREDFREAGVPVLTISCLKDTGIDILKTVYVSKEKARELDKYRLKDGDLLFSRMAAVGRAGIVGQSLRGALFNYHIMRLRLEPSVLKAKYYLAYVRGAAQVENYIREVNHGATRDGINTEQLLNMPVALPPFAEQECIVAEVERRLSVIDELESTVESNLTRADRLRQSILSQAFSGKLLRGGVQLQGIAPIEN